MHRSIVIAYWELIRILRSKKTIFLAIAAPVLGVAVCSSTWGERSLALRCAFPAAAVVFTWALLYIRSLTDRASGFAKGIDSTPVAGAIYFTSRLLIGLVIIAIQAAVFYAGMRIFG